MEKETVPLGPKSFPSSVTTQARLLISPTDPELLMAGERMTLPDEGSSAANSET